MLLQCLIRSPYVGKMVARLWCQDRPYNRKSRSDQKYGFGWRFL